MLGTEYEYPEWVHTAGWTLTMTTLMFIPLFMLQKFISTGGPLKDRIRATFKPGVNVSTIIPGNQGVAVWRRRRRPSQSLFSPTTRTTYVTTTTNTHSYLSQQRYNANNSLEAPTASLDDRLIIRACKPFKFTFTNEWLV